MIQPVLQSLPLGGLIGSTVGFTLIMVGVMTAIGVASKSLAIGATGGYTTFALYAYKTQHDFLMGILIVTLVLVIFGTSFKLWRTEGLPGGPG